MPWMHRVDRTAGEQGGLPPADIVRYRERRRPEKGHGRMGRRRALEGSSAVPLQRVELCLERVPLGMKVRENGRVGTGALCEL